MKYRSFWRPCLQQGKLQHYDDIASDTYHLCRPELPIYFRLSYLDLHCSTATAIHTLENFWVTFGAVPLVIIQMQHHCLSVAIHSSVAASFRNLITACAIQHGSTRVKGDQNVDEQAGSECTASESEASMSCSS